MVTPDLQGILISFKVQDVTADSRKAGIGKVFVAIKGYNLNGNDYVDQAISNGTKLVISDQLELYGQLNTQNIDGNEYYVLDKGGQESFVLIVEDSRDAMAEIAKILYPTLPQNIVAVTGTNGKTSVVNYYQQICELLGQKAASIGTIGITLSDDDLKNKCESMYENLTTGDIVTTRKVLSKLAHNGVDYVALEASSHGLDQKRLRHISFKAAAITNLTHEHLDYHGTFENYKAAKLKLFSENLADNGVAICAIENFPLPVLKTQKVIVVGDGAEMQLVKCQMSSAGAIVEIKYADQIFQFTCNAVAEFQVINMLVAALLAESSGFEMKKIVSVLEKLQDIEGRMQKVTSENYGYQVFVDFAHSPDALEHSLKVLKGIKQNRLHVVFGCGGDRDKTKRSIMGDIARKFADNVIVTSDNPRTEDPSQIINEVVNGNKDMVKIVDRKEAIYRAMDSLKKGDILLIAGKGHEKYQIIGTQKNEFDDVEIVKGFLDNGSNLEQ